ncbi:MAG: hypothetical protein JHC95_06585 [Solirubrobacteraceae bacterium]|nr:hypothetical protein [Solirubrobacteraceae bacterium]
MRLRAGMVGLALGLAFAPSAAFALAPADRVAQPTTLGTLHACSVGGGQVQCRGLNALGELGNGTTAPTTDAVAVRLPDDVHPVAVAAGGFHTCALMNEQRVFCWGANSSGQVGRTDAEIQPLPVEIKVPGQPRLVDVGASAARTCVLTFNRELWCLGHDGDGELGQGRSTWDDSDIAIQPNGSAVPKKVPLPGPVRSFDPGPRSSCAILESGATYCWAFWLDAPVAGTIGDVRSSVPTVPVTPITAPDGEPIRQTASTPETMCVLTSRVWCRGGSIIDRGIVDPLPYGPGGEIPHGNLPLTLPKVPWGELTAVKGVEQPAEIGGFGHRFCVLDAPAGTTVRCWGADAAGTGEVNSHTAVPFALTILGGLAERATLVRGGWTRSCLLEPGSTVATCWGVQKGTDGEAAAVNPSPVTQRNDTPLAAASLPLPKVNGITDVALTGGETVAPVGRGGAFVADPSAGVRLTATTLKPRRLRVSVARKQGSRYRPLRGSARLRTRNGAVTRAVTGRWAGKRLRSGTYRFTVRAKGARGRSVTVRVR